MNTGEDDASCDSSEDVVRTRWDEFGSPWLATVRAVAAATNREVSELPPLYGSVDPEALNTIFSVSTDHHPMDESSPDADSLLEENSSPDETLLPENSDLAPGTESTNSDDNPSITVEFGYVGIRVVVRSDGVLELHSDGSGFE